jgi:branched-chain amino acid transport system permease protein
MSTFLQLTFAGLNVGMVYMLIALGWVVLYQVAHVENLAQGGFVVYGSLVFITAHDSWGLPLPLAILFSLLVCCGIGAVLFVLVLNPLTRRGMAGPVVMTLGAAILLGEVARQIWGLNDKSAKPFLSTEPLRVFGATVLPHSLLLWLGTAVLVGAGFLVFERTIIGKALRACSDNYDGAQIVGINPTLMQFASFQVAALFGGAGGVLLSPLLGLGWASVFTLGLIGLIGAIAGRWAYLPAAAASVIIGLFANYAGGYVSTSWQDAFVYGAFLVILLVLREGRSRQRLRLTVRRPSRSTPPLSTRREPIDPGPAGADRESLLDYQQPKA